MEKYTKLQIWLHWIVFILVIFQYLLHEPIARAFDFRLEGKEFTQSALITLHLAFGGLIFILVASRIWLRVEQGVPEAPSANILVTLISKTVHWSFYGVLLLLPITGGAAWFQLSVNAGKAHETLKGILLLLIFLHLCGLLFHCLILKSNLLKRMWG